MLSSSEHDSKIKVYSDGVKLGWNVLAIICTFGLGLYVSNVIAPVQQRADNQEDRLDKTESMLDHHISISTLSYQQILKDHHILIGRMDTNEAKINHVKESVVRFQKIFDTQTNGMYGNQYSHPTRGKSNATSSSTQ